MRSSISNSNQWSLGWKTPAKCRNLVIIILVISAFLAADRMLSWGFERLLLRSEFRYSKLFRGDLDADVVIFGNSRGVNGFYSPDMAKAMGCSVVNMSFNGLSATTVEILFTEYLRFNKAPKELIIEITCLHGTSSNRNVLQLYGRVSEALNGVWMLESPWMAKVQTYVATTNRFSAEFYLRVLYYLKRSDQTWINRYSIDPGFARNYSPTPSDTVCWGTVNPKALLAIQNTVALALDQGIRVKIVITPYLPNYIRAVNIDEWKQEVEAKLNLPVIDLSLSVTKTSEFADPLHMNLSGFRTFLPILMESLND